MLVLIFLVISYINFQINLRLLQHFGALLIFTQPNAWKVKYMKLVLKSFHWKKSSQNGVSTLLSIISISYCTLLWSDCL